MLSGGCNEPTRHSSTAAVEGTRVSSEWQPWTALAGFAFFGNFAWEMAQMPLFRMRNLSGWAMVGECAQATAGDAVLTLMAYGVAALCHRRPRWLLAPVPIEGAAFLGVGVAATMALEWWNVTVRHSWAYSATMPTVAGLGLAPLMQWVLLPPFTLWLARQHVVVTR